MHRDLVRYLDGELPRESLPSELAAEAAEWDEIFAAARELRSVEAPPWLEDRVMRALPAPGRGRRLVRLLLEPRTVRVRPIAVLLTAAAVVLAFLLIPGARTVDSPAPLTAAASGGEVSATEPGVVVQFVFVRPDAAAWRSPATSTVGTRSGTSCATPMGMASGPGRSISLPGSTSTCSSWMAWSG